MSGMATRVARLLCKLDGRGPWDELSAPGYENEARQIITAMREPTEAMIFEALIEPGASRAVIVAIYQSMIDGATK